MDVRLQHGLIAALLALTFGCSSLFRRASNEADITPRRGVVVAEHREATKVGVAILERGGNAVDAAVATAFALAVVYPQAGNLGGGGFAIYVPHLGRPDSIDFREVAPLGASALAYLNANGDMVDDRSRKGPLSVGVPGTPAGLIELKEKYGSPTLSLADVIEPAIDLARNGFPVDPVLAELLRDPEQRAKLESHAFVRQLFYPGGEPLRQGTILRQPDLGRTLERIADGGKRGFYKQSTAKSILAELDRVEIPGVGVVPGVMTAQDLAQYEPVWRAPLRGWFRGNELITMPPPSSGGVALLQILSILEGFPLDADRERSLEAGRVEAELPEEVVEADVVRGTGLSERMLHWWIEAMRRAFADRAEHLGDPAFVDVPVDELLSSEWIAERRISIGEGATPEIRPMPPRDFGPTQPGREGTETTHVSVVDREGNAISLTTTLNSFFGSGIYVPSAGFFLNNEMDDFAIRAGVPNQFGLVGSTQNALAPGKRPLSSMTPTIIRDNRRAVRMVLGSPGGPKIITSVFQVILRSLVLEQPLEAAVRAPRLHQQWNPPHTLFELGWDDEVLSALATNRGHDTRRSDQSFGSVQAILIGDDGEAIGVSDPRRGGVAGIEKRDIPWPASRWEQGGLRETVQ